MTCREFKHSAAALTLWELSRSRDGQVLGHADACETCEMWLRKQRSLAASMRTLQAQTAGLEAGPDVERALRAAFRRTAATSTASPLSGVERYSDSLPLDPTDGLTPLAMRLSRFFEIGAYVAVAAAMVVGVFLGVQLLQQRSRASGTKISPVQGASVPASTQPVAQKPAPSLVEESSISSPERQPVTAAGSRVRRQRPSAESQTAAAAGPAVADVSQTSTDDGYVALMFCDPLSCSSDSQVVRMELPATGNTASQGVQPQMADVVVGYDGVVRAVRIVN